MHVIEFGVSLT